MTVSEFLEVTGEIEKFYDKTLNQTESKIWYEELQKLNKERYRQLSRECYKNNKFMPKLADIVALHRTTSLIKKDEDVQFESCDTCDSKGFVIYKQKENGILYDFVARCTCKNANKYLKFPSIMELGLVKI